MNQLLIALGLVMIIEGTPWFLSPRMMRSFLAQLSLLPDRSLRVTGLFIIGLGLLVVRLATG